MFEKDQEGRGGTAEEDGDHKRAEALDELKERERKKEGVEKKEGNQDASEKLKKERTL